MIKYRSLWLSATVCAASIACFAQPNRIVSRIDNSRTVTLPGRVHPLANAANDAGLADSSLPLFLTILLKPSADQQSGLDRLLQQQQNPASTSFHKWLTPEQYADQFGASAADTAQIAAWLQTQGFTVDPVSRSRTYLTFSGTGGQAQAVFGTAIHRYVVNGVSHYANANDPKIPAALSGLVSGIRGLNDFHPKAQLRKPAAPQFTDGPGVHVLAPADFAAIYDVNPLYTAGINGSGQTIMIVGQSALYSSGGDITSFWSKFGITTATLSQKLVNTHSNPGVVPIDAEEADLDVEWAGAVARGATIAFVYSTDVWTSAVYAVDQAFGSVLSMSYGSCEMSDLVDLPGYRQTVQQANAEGITWLAAAGDSGAADCDYNAQVAEGGLGIGVPAAIPEVTAMGGTNLSDYTATYWGASGTALGYIPEIVWNETAIAGELSAGGGGASLYFPQPSWQTTAGVPNDGWRHLPDLSLNAGAYHDPYYVVLQGAAEVIGGTSAATPTMAGVVALLNQYISNGQSTSGLGNINPELYRLSQSAPSVFHDVSNGSNLVPCAYGSPQCNNGQQGYTAGAGYDSASGIGSVDASLLVHQWSTALPTAAVVVPSINQNPVYETTSSSGKWTFQLTLTEEAGIGATLTNFAINGVDHSSQIASLFGTASIAPLQSVTASYTLSLTSVPVNETFTFSGTDARGNSWSTALTVPFQGPMTQLSIAGIGNAATGQVVFAPGMIMSVYGTGLGTLAQAAATIPLPEYMAGFYAFVNKVPTPLYYVGPNQVNLQVPYETTVGSADLNLQTPYESLDKTFSVSSAGPGIFMFPDGRVNPSNTGSVGQTLTMFITGDGQVTPSLPDGTTPSSSTPLSRLPKPRQTLTVTVAGIPVAQTGNWFYGIPSGLVGATQINFTIPAGVPSGRQPVVVTVGTASSPPAYITIQ